MKEKLQKLNEPDLRIKVIIPLMKLLVCSLGCSYVLDNHGPNEKGKDVIYEFTNTFKQKVYGAILLKAKNIGKGKDVENIEREAKEAVQKFNDPQNIHGTVKIHELFIINSFSFTPHFCGYIKEQSGVSSFPNLHIIDGDTLAAIIGKEIYNYNYKKSGDNYYTYTFSVDTFKKFCEKNIHQPIDENNNIKILSSNEDKEIST